MGSKIFWTDEELELLKTCDGMTVKQIQEKIPNKSNRSVHYWCNKMNVNIQCKRKSTKSPANPYMSKYMLIRKYKNKYNIILDKDKGIDTLSAIEWYELMLNKTIHSMPKEITSKKENWIVIMRYVAFTKCSFKTKEDILSINKRFLENHKLTTIKYAINQKIYIILQECFPEYNIKPWELPIIGSKYFKDEENIMEVIEWFIESNNLTVIDILNSTGFNQLFISSGITTLCNGVFDGIHDLFIWYFNKKGLSYTIHDFYYKPQNYWNDINNLKIQIRRYITYLENNGLLKSIKEDIPYYFSFAVIKNTGLLSILKSIQRYEGYKNVFELINEMYPDFNIDTNINKIIGIDGKSFLNSMEEKTVFDYIYKELNVTSIKAIGYKKSSNFYNTQTGERYCPDFIIENVLDKPIVIEYYGLYVQDSNNKLFIDYFNKTIRKNEYYYNNTDIYFLDLYPKDLKNNCITIKEKFNKLLDFGYKYSERR